MKNEISSQYFKVLAMMEECIDNYDDELWTDRSYQNPAWQVCYHGLFYTNIYLSPAEDQIRKWAEEREGYHDLKTIPSSQAYVFDKTFNRGEMKEFLNQIKESVPAYMEKFEPDKPCWPFWYKQNQLEFHMNNLRHFQQHTAELLERLNNVAPVSYQWR